MDNLEANSKSTQPETQNTGRNKTNSQPSKGESGTNNPGTNNPGTNNPFPALIEIGEHKPSNSASVSNTRPAEGGTNNPDDPWVKPSNSA